MKLVSYDELPEEYDSGRALVYLAAFGGFADRANIDAWRHRTSAFAEYTGLFALDRGSVVGQTFVRRIAYTFPHGTETVSGIAAVSTRLDHARAGVARRLLEEVHRREREAGIRYSTLWTNRSWGAHRLYEKLGYRDIYNPSWAVRVVTSGRPGRRPGGVRPGRRSDLSEMDRLHREYAKGRWGFVERPRRFLSVAAATGDFRPEEESIVVRGRDGLSGYAHLTATHSRIISGELVAMSSSARRSLVSALEGRVRSGVVAFRDGVVDDLGSLLAGRGYEVAPAGWFGLMATSLDRKRSRAQLSREFGTTDPRFLCLGGDRF